MLQRKINPRWVKLTAFFLIGAVLQFFLQFSIPTHTLAQGKPASVNQACAQIQAPLTPEEQNQARIAWQYFVKNYQPTTGFTNSVGGYPSGSMWDIGNYLMALNAVRWLDIIDQKEFDSRLNTFLNTLGKLPLFENTLPNKTYHAGTGQMVDYNNNLTDRGIGWSALDLGRVLAAFHVIRVCHPQYNDWLKGLLSRWQIDRSVQDGQLFGTMITPDGSTLLVQEGRLGYEEYAVRGYELWGYQAPKARALEPMKFVDIYGVQVPVDQRDYASSGANNYVVSESYILDGIEFGLSGELADYSARVLQAQENRYKATGQLTAVSEDNIDGPPYFLYNTVYANGVPWATITDQNQPYPNLRSISTKAAFGWRYLYPGNSYAQKTLDAVKNLYGPEQDGFYAGLYEETKQPNKALTGNTNGLILEILYYKARGNRPLIAPTGSGSVPSRVTPTPVSLPAEPTPNPASSPQTASPTPIAAVATAIPIPPVGPAQARTCPALTKSLTTSEQRYAKAAWQYFELNVEPSGLVNDRRDLKGATLWGIGDYLMALHAAHSLDIISPKLFDQRIRNLLGTLGRLPLFTGELPHRGYNTRSLQPIDYGNNAKPEGTGWSSLDVGRLMVGLYTLKTCYPEYATAVDQIPLDWSYFRLIRNGALYRATVTQTNHGQTSPRITPETRLGYEEYAARTFQLWGFEVNRSAVGGQYQTATVEGLTIPVQRLRSDVKSDPNPYTMTTPFLLYGLEFGFDPQMRSLVLPMLQAQATRYHRTQMLTTAGIALIERQPFIVHNTLFANGEPWSTLDNAGQAIPDSRLVNTADAFAFAALLPADAYGRELREGVLDLYSPALGYYEGFYEKTGKTSTALSAGTNSLILESLLYQATQRPLIAPDRTMTSPWWQAIKAGDQGKGLPAIARQTALLVADQPNPYWLSLENTSPAAGAIDAPSSLKTESKPL